MGLLDRFRRRKAGAPGETRQVGATMDDVERLRQALRDEADRLGRATGLSMTLFMEYTQMDLTGVELYELFGYLHAQGDIANVEQDSFGNLKFDLTERLTNPTR